MKKILLLIIVVMFLEGCENFVSSGGSGNTEEEVVEVGGGEEIEEEEEGEEVTYFHDFVPVGYYEAEGEVVYGIELTENNQILLYWGGAAQSEREGSIVDLDNYTISYPSENELYFEFEELAEDRIRINFNRIYFTKLSITEFHFKHTSGSYDKGYPEDAVRENVNKNYMKAEKPEPYLCVAWDDAEIEYGFIDFTLNYNPGVNFTCTVMTEEGEDYTVNADYALYDEIYLYGNQFESGTYDITLMFNDIGYSEKFTIIVP